MKRLILILSFIVTMAGGCCLAQNENIILPNIRLYDTENNSINIAKSNDNGPIMVIFWATWCNCTRELELMNDSYASWQRQYGLTIYSVAIDDSRSSSKIKPFVEQRSWDFATLIDDESRLRTALKVTNPPHLFLFDSNKRCVYQQIGYSNDFIRTITEELEKIK